MCMSIEYHLYLLHFLYYVNDYNLFIIFVFMFMGGSMSAVMLLLCYLPPNDYDYYNIICCIICCIIQYVQYHNCISNIFCRSFLYESCVSIKFISSSSCKRRQKGGLEHKLMLLYCVGIVHTDLYNCIS